MSEKLSTQPYKGTRDFYPQEMRLRHRFLGVVRRVLETAAFEEYNGPMLESLDLYAAKSGEEIATKQTYNFTDRGDRRLALRPEMTPTVARMVAARMNDLVFPLKWFSIPNMYRYEAPQRGRLREFWQLNVDIFGCDTYEADLDCISSAIEIMRAFGADETMFTVHINNRRFFNDVIAAIAGTDGEGAKAVSKVIDRKNKVVKTLVSGVGFTMKSNKVKVYTATAKVLGKNAAGLFEVDAGGTTIAGKHLVVATGSVASVVPGTLGSAGAVVAAAVPTAVVPAAVALTLPAVVFPVEAVGFTPATTSSSVSPPSPERRMISLRVL